jgi:CO/xanthine dehydrogenase FAD-binding subunit
MFGNVAAFYRPASVPEALRLLQKAKGQARVLAGGTDLALAAAPSVRFLVDITRAGLTYIRQRERTIAIGATTTMAQLEESPIVNALAGGLLCRAAASCGAIEIRNVATLGGNMANGSPAADMATPLLVLDAGVVLATARKKHKLPLSGFLSGIGIPAAPSLLIEVVVPTPPNGSRCGWSFQKFGRTAVDISVVNVAAGLELDTRGRVKWAHIAVGAAAPAPLRALAAEELAAGRVLDRTLIAEIGDVVVGELQPITDQRASAEYRRELVRVLIGRALEECVAEAEHAI